MLTEIDIGPLTIHTFGIFFALSFVVAGALFGRRLIELGRPVDWAYEVVFAALIGGVVGARAAFILQNLDTVRDDLLGAVFSGSGLVWYGGAIGGALGVFAWARWRHFLERTLLDVAAPALAAGYAVGRIGCQVSGDGDYGKAWGGPWAMSYPDGEVPTTQTVHPTPVYETLTMALIAWALWRLRDRVAPGVLFGLYLIASSLERLAVEFLRRNDTVVAGLTLAQLQSIGLGILGVVLVAVWRGEGPLIRQSELSRPPSSGTIAPVR